MKTIRLAKETDVPAICEIYKYYVKNSVATFAYEPLDEEEWKQKLINIKKEYPFLVCEKDGIVLGYAYASQFREKEAYHWDVELTIYMHPDSVHQHLGSALLKELLHILTLQHFQLAYSCITIPNEASIALHNKLNFQHIGTFKRTGYKFHQWLDIAWMEKILSNTSTPLIPLKVEEVIQEDYQVQLD